MKIYLETTVPNFLFANDDPEKRDATKEFWRWLKLGTEEVFISELVLDEIAQAPVRKRKRLEAVLQELDHTVLKLDLKVIGFGDSLVQSGVVPVRYSDDALHVAVAAINELEVLASWNLQHIVKLKTVNAVNALCVAYGLRPPRIHTPQEILP